MIRKVTATVLAVTVLGISAAMASFAAQSPSHSSNDGGHEMSEAMYNYMQSHSSGGSSSSVASSSSGVSGQATGPALEIMAAASSATNSSTNTGEDSTWSYHPDNDYWTYAGATNGFYFISWRNQIDRYYFVNGIMQTGFVQDPEGNTYYLNPVADGYRGRAVTNTSVEIDGVIYVFGADGRLTQTY